MISREVSRSRKKRELFFVDTKSTCFLCLQNIVPDAPPPPPLMTICDDEDEIANRNREESCREGAGETEEQEPFCLRRIFKLLQLDVGRVLSKQLTAGPFLGSNMAITDLSVVLCKACRQVSHQLSEIFREWEVLQMKLDHSVQKLATILQKSDSDPSRRAEFHKQFLDPLDLLHGSIMELMRKKTLDKCTKHLRKSVPRVNFLGAGSVSVSSSVVSGPPEHMKSPPAREVVAQNKKHACHACGVQYQHRSSLIRHRQRYCQSRPSAPPPPSEERNSTKIRKMSPANEALPSATVLEELLISAPRIIGEKGEDLLQCPICHEGEFRGDSALKEHMCTSHLNYFFASAKLHHCSQARFRALCTQRLPDELASSFVLAPQDKDTDDGTGTRSSCTHCSYQCSNDLWSKYSHLSQDHFSVYASKLAELQSSDPPALHPPPSHPSNRYQCQGCKRVYSTYYKYRRHMQRHFCGGSKLASADNVRTKPFRCSDCGKAFICLNSISRHQKLYCLHRQNVTAVARPRNSRTLCPPVRCQTCGKLSFTEKSARRHRCPPASSSSNSAPKTTRTILSSSIPGTSYASCTLCGKYMHSTSVWRHQRATCPYRDTQAPPSGDPLSNRGPLTVYKCLSEDCDLEFPLHSSLRAHISENHPTETKCRCGQYYTHLTQHRLACTAPQKDSPGPSGPAEPVKRKVACEYCGAILSSRSHLRRHERQNCPAAKAAAQGTGAGEAEEGAIFEEEEELMELDQSSCIFNLPKIEVLEPREVQLFIETEMTDGDVVVRAEDAYPEEESTFPEERYFPPEEQNGGKTQEDVKLLLPEEDPLLLF